MIKWSDFAFQLGNGDTEKYIRMTSVLQDDDRRRNKSSNKNKQNRSGRSICTR